MKKTIRVEFHVHTKYSYDCATSFKDLIESCKAKKIDVLAVADHNQIAGALRLQAIAPFRVIVGEEIQTCEGEIIGLFLKKFIKPGQSMGDTIKEIRRQHGLVYLPHPFDTTTRKTAILANSLARHINSIDIIEVFNGRTIKPWDNLQAERFTRKVKKIACIGSDAHTSYEIGRNYMTMQDFATQQEFLTNLSKAKIHRSVVLPWVFILTKYYRYIKRHFPDNEVHTCVCDICGSNKVKLIYPKRGVAQKQYFITDNSYGEHSQIVKCADCDLIYCSPRDASEKLIERYTDFEDSNYEKERIARSMTHSRVFKKVQVLQSTPGKLLDIGCATGTLLKVAKRSGWGATGIEPSAWASKMGKKKFGLNIIQGSLETHKFKSEEFDVVTCLDVIEHVSSPKMLLKEIHRILKENGILCLVTPDISSMLSRIMGENWWHIRPDHIYYFSKETLVLLLESQGFEVVKIARYSWTFSLDYWISRLQNKAPFLYKILSIFKDKHFLTMNFLDSLEVYARKV